ncbi:MAG: hypothetical protein P1U46_00410 [Patescibacteria group bacterium]|nr:hypothetical protein [Patescibacteria group bacterium]
MGFLSQSLSCRNYIKNRKKVKTFLPVFIVYYLSSHQALDTFIIIFSINPALSLSSRVFSKDCIYILNDILLFQGIFSSFSYISKTSTLFIKFISVFSIEFFIFNAVLSFGITKLRSKLFS